MLYIYLPSFSFHHNFSHFSRYLREFLSYIWRFTRAHYFEFGRKSRRRTIRRRNAENSRSGLSSRRLVSSRRYLSPELTAGRRTRASPSSPGDFVFTFLAFASLRRLRSSYPSRVTRGAATRKRGAHRELRKPRNCLFGGKSEAGRADAQKAIIRTLSSLIRFRGGLYPED